MLCLNFLSRRLRYLLLSFWLPCAYPRVLHIRDFWNDRIGHWFIDPAFPLHHLALLPHVPLRVNLLDLALNLLHLRIFFLLLYQLLFGHLLLQPLLHLHKAIDHLHDPIWEVDLHRPYRHDHLLTGEHLMHRLQTIQSLDINTDIAHDIDSLVLMPSSIFLQVLNNL